MGYPIVKSPVNGLFTENMTIAQTIANSPTYDGREKNKNYRRL